MPASKFPTLRALRATSLPHSDRVLVLVDFINPFDFPGAERLLPGALRAARATARLKQELVKKQVPAIYANDHYGTWHAEFSDVLHACQALPWQRGQIARLLAPAPDDLTILKPPFGIFCDAPGPAAA